MTAHALDPPATAGPSRVEIVGSGIDTLWLGYYCQLPDDTIAELDDLKQIALGIEPESGERLRTFTQEVPCSIADWDLIAFPYGHKNYRWRFSNDDLRLLIHQNAGDGSPNVLAELGSDFLWRESAIGAHQIVTAWVARISDDQIDKVIVSRADVCCDFQGWEPEEGTRRHYLCQAGDRNEWDSRASFSGFTFGRGATVCTRIYLKTVEIDVHHKQYFVNVWARVGYDPDRPVWRLEFQFQRTPLRELDCATPDRLFENVNGLWAYGCRWCRLTVPNGDSNKARWPTHPAWFQLTHTPIDLTRSTPQLYRQRCATRAENMTDMTLGCLSTMAASLGIQSLPRAIAEFRRRAKAKLDGKGMKFSEMVRAKLHKTARVHRDSRDR
jgi:hypothetical protein